jgi:hypothetical protein
MNLQENIHRIKQVMGLITEKKDYFKGSEFGDDEGNHFQVEDVYDFVKKNKKKYYKEDYPLENIKHNLEWWNKNYDIKNPEHKSRMMNADTSYPLLVVIEKNGNHSVADGLNRLYKAIKVEKKKKLPVYVVNKSEIEHLSLEKKSEIDETFLRRVIGKAGRTASKLKSVPKVQRFKNLDDAIMFYQNKKVKFESDWKVIIDKFRSKQINATQFTTELNNLKVRYGIKDVNYFNDMISKLNDSKKVSNLKNIAGNAPQENILKSPNQLGKNISAGGSNNLGVFDLGNGYVAKKTSHGFKDDSIVMLNYKDKIKSPRISKTVQVKNMVDKSGKESIYIVQQKSVGRPMSDMSIDEIRKIPDIHRKNFEKDLIELKNIGVTVDPSKMNNFIYDPSKGIQLIDLNVGSYLSEPGRLQHTINHVLKK